MTLFKAPFATVLLITCAALFCLLVIEVLYFKISLYESSESFAHQASPAQKQAVLTTTHNLQSKEYDIISEKPLFIEGRKAAATPSIGGTLNPTPSNTSGNLNIRLVGVGLIGSNNLALIIDDKGKYHRLHVNDKLSGWSVKSIKKNTVSFSKNGQSKLFQLEKKRTLIKQSTEQ